MPRELKDITFNNGYNQCEARMSILKNETVQKDLDYEEITPANVGVNSFAYVDHNGKPTKIKLASIIDERQGTQSDWLETDEESLAFIKNKPELILDKDLISAYNVGGIKAGDVIPAGTSVTEIINKILSIAESVAIKFGILDSIVDVNPGALEDYLISVEDALSKGVRFDNIDLRNQYYILLIPEDADLLVSNVFQGGYKISTRVKQITDYQGKKWIMYYPSVPTTGIYTFMYKIMREE